MSKLRRFFLWIVRLFLTFASYKLEKFCVYMSQFCFVCFQHGIKKLQLFMSQFWIVSISLRILTVASYKIVIASLHLLNLTLFLRNLNLQLAILTLFLRILHLHLTILFCLFSSWNKKNSVWQLQLFSKNCKSTKSLSRKVCSLGRHICNASGQLKQDQVLSKWMGETWNLKNGSLNSRLNYIFQISNKIWN